MMAKQVMRDFASKSPICSRVPICLSSLCFVERCRYLFDSSHQIRGYRLGVTV